MKIESPRTFADLVGFRPEATEGHEQETHGTTVLALRYDQGVLMLADRRATMGNLIMYDQAEKVMPLDDASLVAISGSFARSIEVCRMLKHSFKYYKRMFLSEMSQEGKLQEISRALAGNLPAAMQGIGVFLPILATYDPGTERFSLYFFDTAGARFEHPEYATAGSGSERIRGIFEYLSRTKGSFAGRKLKDVLGDGLHMLDIAADLDSATGGFLKVPPCAWTLTSSGVQPLELDAKTLAPYRAS